MFGAGASRGRPVCARLVHRHAAGSALSCNLDSLAPVAAELTTAASGVGRTRTLLYVTGVIATVAVVVVATRAARRALNAELQESPQ